MNGVMKSDETEKKLILLFSVSMGSEYPTYRIQYPIPKYFKLRAVKLKKKTQTVLPMNHDSGILYRTLKLCKNLEHYMELSNMFGSKN